MKTKIKTYLEDIESRTVGYRLAAGAMAALAFASTITFAGEMTLKNAQATDKSAGLHEIARLRDDTPSSEKGQDLQVFGVQPANEAVIEFANEDDLERLTR